MTRSASASSASTRSVSTRSASTQPVFVPWPVPLALGLLIGVAAAGPIGPRAATVLGVVIAIGAAGWLLLSRRPWPSAMWPHAPRASLALLGPAALAAGLGLIRAAEFERRPNPVAGLFGQTLLWSGTSDGAVLHANVPVRASLVLVAPRGGWPTGSAPVGRMSIEGVVEAAAGKRNPGGFDYAAHLRRRGVSGQLFVQQFGALPAVLPRQRVQGGVVAGLSPEGGALMAAMTLGIRDDLGELRDSFAAAGMAHLLALSGLHVGVLLLSVERLLRALPRWRTPALALVTLGFVWLVGASPSVVRAATMALAALSSRAFGAGRVRPWTALALATLVGLLLAPQMLHDLSFQLSYLAVAGMLVLLPPWLDRLGIGQASGRGSAPLGATVAPELAGLAGSARRRARYLALSGLAVSGAAQLPSVSIVLSAFGSLPLLSPLVNVVAVPLAGLLVPLGFLAGMVGLVAEPLARVVNLVTQPLVGALISLARITAEQPQLYWGEVSWLGHACWAAFVVALCVWSRRPGRLKHTACVALVAGGVALAVPAGAQAPDVWFLDVGQGDSVLIRLPRGQGVLIDGGGSPFSDFDVGRRVVLPALRALGVRRLAAVVVTHPDADHVEGLFEVLSALPVGLLITGPPDPAASLDSQLRALALARGVQVHEARRGESLVLGNAPGYDLRLHVLNPPADAEVSANERSVALALSYGGAAIALFLGDLGLATEPDLAVPPAPMLMVPHHGSRGSTGAGLVRAASPRWAVVSVGRNQYGHPSPEVVARLEEAGVHVLTTLGSGAVRFDLRRPYDPPTTMVGAVQLGEKEITYP